MGTFTRYSSPKAKDQKRRNLRFQKFGAETCLIEKMLKIYGIVVFVFAAFALATGDRKDAVKVVDLAEELAKSRQDLAMSREETKEFIKRENDKLRQEDNKLRRKNKKLEQEVAKLRREMRRDKSEMQKSMREADVKMNKSIRQRDGNNTLELQNIVRNSFRQNDFTSQLKKTINNQIKAYLDDNKICVAGSFNAPRMDSYYTLDFGHTFQRVPAFTASLNGKRPQVYQYHVYNLPPKVTESSAVLLINTKDLEFAKITWMACL